jgi:endonuclease YncB( thermonuclease family)
MNKHEEYLAKKYYCIWRINFCKRRKSYCQFGLAGLSTWITPTSIYDGDTFKGLMNYRGVVDQWTFRMNGYDSPEMKPLRSSPNRDAEKAKAIIARDFLGNMIMDKPVYAKILNFDKYGRLLVELYNGKIHVNKCMIENGHGYPYAGGKKQCIDYS